jgi:hypothetical protein
MFHLLGLVGLGYLGAAGVATNAAVVGRGLVRAARSAAGGNLRDAAIEALGAMVAPVAMSYVATARLLLDVVGGAGGLVRPLLHQAEPAEAERYAA